MQAHYFVGLDIAAETFTTAVGTSPWTLQVAATEFTNDAEGLLAFGAWLQRYQLLPAQTICCMEATGTYGELVGYWLDQAHTGHGYATAACRAAIDHVCAHDAATIWAGVTTGSGSRRSMIGLFASCTFMPLNSPAVWSNFPLESTGIIVGRPQRFPVI